MSDAIFRGTGPALVTPFDADGEVDLEVFTSLVERQIAGGVHFLVPCGTTGESATLTPTEQSTLIRRTVEIAGGRLPVLAGAGSNVTRAAVAFTRAAADAGADGVLVVTPYYNKPSLDGLALHYSAVAGVGLPIVLYNVPGRTGANVTPDALDEIVRRVPSVVGVKEAAGDFGQFQELVRRRPEGFVVLSGDDDLAAGQCAIGGDGLISVVANEDPAGASEMVRSARAGRLETARAHMHRLLPLIRANFLESNPGPVKAAMARMGLLENRLRAPLAPVRSAVAEKIEAALAHAELLDAPASG
ncbi:MAG TPA: 4-hydroxy-tetrahydrodipicolinate synthase [Longimicrobiales bacterium]|nr:4-hydroxy-tetrahydrodipicolinate synthase [Longimicrobiales bacterium]